MKQRYVIGFVVCALWVAPAWCQLRVQGGTATFNEFDCDEPAECDPDREPLSGDMGNTGDLYVEFDLEVGDVIYGRAIESREQTTGSSGTPILNLVSAESMTFIIDGDNTSNFDDRFEWYEDGSFAEADKLAELQPDGDFLVRGALVGGVMFDLAEHFVAGEALEPGDVVQVDPSRADGVVLAASNSPTVGVVSGNPGILLGGALFSVEDLDARGHDLRERFLAQEVALTQAAAGDKPEIAALQHRLERLRAGASRSQQEGAGTSREPDEITSLEGRLRRAALDRFAETAFVSVALAGRLPVKVVGPVRRGDYLTASNVPGLARKATGPGAVIGLALEDLEPGAETVMMLVQNGWYGGEATTLASTDELRERLAEQQSIIAAQNEQIDSLERQAASVAARMVSLERRLNSLDGQVLRSAYRRVD